MKFWWEISFVNAVAILVMSGKFLLYLIFGTLPVYEIFKILFPVFVLQKIVLQYIS